MAEICNTMNPNNQDSMVIAQARMAAPRVAKVQIEGAEINRPYGTQAEVPLSQQPSEIMGLAFHEAANQRSSLAASEATYAEILARPIENGIKVEIPIDPNRPELMEGWADMVFEGENGSLYVGLLISSEHKSIKRLRRALSTYLEGSDSHAVTEESAQAETEEAI